MSKKGGPDLKKFMDKKLSLKLNGNRKVVGILRGYDLYMNLVLDEAVEEVSATERNEIGVVVIRGNSVVLMEPLEKVDNLQ
uniref:Small nuclear ribonucleoprotein G n=1 Tax=Arcella intermedia TaxID=1963864 RepID=A0A6B2LVU3_9EUKA